MAKKKKTARTGVKKSDTASKKSTAASSKKPERELDVVEQAQRELRRLEAAGESAKPEASEGSFSWGALVGGVLIGAALALLGTKMMGGSIGGAGSAKDLEEKLPAIIEPLGGGMALESVGAPEKVGDVYKFTIKFADVDDEFTSYITGDAGIFFVEGLDVAELLGEAGSEATGDEAGEVEAASCETINKSSEPELAAYIVSDCPYGKQMQQVMLDAIAQAPELQDRFVVRYFFDTINDDGTAVAMHGASEGVENIRQICLREEQPDLYWPYVECYAASAGGESAAESCVTQTGVNAANLSSCMTTTSRGPTFARADDALATQHAITGSPSLIINDTEKVSESAFGGRNANGLKSIVCCSGDNAFSFCDAALTTSVAMANGDC